MAALCLCLSFSLASPPTGSSATQCFLPVLSPLPPFAQPTPAGLEVDHDLNLAESETVKISIGSPFDLGIAVTTVSISYKGVALSPPPTGLTAVQVLLSKRRPKISCRVAPCPILRRNHHAHTMPTHVRIFFCRAKRRDFAKSASLPTEQAVRFSKVPNATP